MFDFARHLDGTANVRVRVECVPTARDEHHPIRMVIVGEDDVELARMKFTPAQANDSAAALARLMGQFLPVQQAWKLADGLRRAAITVWATRN